MAKETILKILRDPLLKVHKRGIVVKVIYPDVTTTPRNYMIVLLNDKSKLYYSNLCPEFAVNLARESSTCIGLSETAYIVKPTIQDYLEICDMYRKWKGKNGVDNKNNKE